MTFDTHDHYFLQAKKEGYLARSSYKLQEIDNKFHLFTSKTKKILDIWCAPWSWLQYVDRRLQTLHISDFSLIWFDIKNTQVNWNNIFCYQEDIENVDKVKNIIQSHSVISFDCIVSDIAPDTIGHKNTDAMRSIALLESTLWIYEKYLDKDWKFVIKIFMWPGFEEFYKNMQIKFWWSKKVKLYKPKACRKASKEIYIIKW